MSKLINPTSQGWFSPPKTKQEAITLGKHSYNQNMQDQARSQTLEKNGLETPIISPEMAGVGLVRAGQGIAQTVGGFANKSFNTVKQGQKAIQQGKGFTAGSIGGDIGAYGTTQAIDKATSNEFKQNNPNLYTAMQVGGGLVGGIAGGMKAEKKFLSQPQTTLGYTDAELVDLLRKPKQTTTLGYTDQELIQQLQPKSQYATLGENLAGGSAGALESQFNQRDYNDDGQHDYKDNLAGLVGGIIGINGAKKLFPKAFKDDVQGAKTGMFVGANGDELGAFSDIASKKTMREIDDSKATVNSTDVALAPRKYQIKEALKLQNKGKELKDKDLYRQGLRAEEEAMKIGSKEIWLNTPMPLSKFLNHEELYAKYPELKDTNIAITDDIVSQGKFDGKNIYVSAFADDKKSTLLHEIQHAIQGKENWAKGGSADGMTGSQLVDTIKKKYGNVPFINNAEIDYLDGVITEDEMYKKIIDGVSGSYEGGLKGLQYDTYKRLWGEQQARATQHRLNMTPEQRAKEDWTKTLERVEGKYNEPIIKYDNGVSMSTDDNVANFLKKAQARLDAKNQPIDIPKGVLARAKLERELGRKIFNPNNNKNYIVKTGGDILVEKNGQYIKSINENSNNWIKEQLKPKAKPVSKPKQEYTPKPREITNATDTIPQYLYHGTSSKNIQSILNNGFLKGSELKDGAFRGGGHDAIQDSISFADNPKNAEVFGRIDKQGAVFKVELKPNLKMAKVSNIDYAEDINDLIPELRKQGYNAVDLRHSGEGEIMILDKSAIKNIADYEQFKATDGLKRLK